MSEEEIVDACDYAVNKLGFKAMVMQSGEDGWYTEEKLINIVSGIRKKCECLLILSIGERSASTYKKFYDLGVRAALLRFETSDEALYTKMRPGHKLQARLNLLRELGRMGYLLMSGFLIGLPGQSEDSIMADIDLTASLGVEMFSFGPFISHPDTPLAKLPSAAMDMALDTIAKARLKYPDAKILATTALESLDKINGLKNALLAGANSLMINVTPPKHQPFYEIYPGHSAKVVDVEKKIEETIALLRSIGRAPADLGI